MHNLSCENEFYLYENEKWFSHQRLSTYPRFETQAPGNSEMACYGHKIPQRCTEADKSNNKAHTVMIKLAMYRNICLAFNLIPVLVFSNDFGVPCKFAQATRTGREKGGGGGVENCGTVRLSVWRHVSRQWLSKWWAKCSSKRRIKVTEILFRFLRFGDFKVPFVIEN